MTDRELLQAAGDALYGLAGPWWYSCLADQLRVSSRTVRRWASGERAPNPFVWKCLAEMMMQRSQRMAELVDALEAKDAAISEQESE